MSNTVSLLVGLACWSVVAQAQVIRNPQNLDVPQAKVNVIYRTTLRVLSENFDVEEISELYPVTLTLGSDEERYVEDEDNKVDAIYLKTWDEKKFAISVMRLALENFGRPRVPEPTGVGDLDASKCDCAGGAALTGTHVLWKRAPFVTPRTGN